MTSVVERLTALKALLKEKHIDYYLIPTGDYHGSEYVSEYFKVREYFSGFTGSNGTLLVGEAEICLWTDGRYFIQAEKELSGTGILLQKMGEKNVPTIADYLKEHVKDGDTIGFDGTVVTADFGIRLENSLKEKKVQFVYKEDIAGNIWEERPKFVKKDITVLEEEVFGISTPEKFKLVRENMKQNRCTALILSKLDDIMWLYNIRGCDVACNPVAFSYSIVTSDKAYLFVDKNVMNESLKSKADKENFLLEVYDTFYDCLNQLNLGDKIWISKENSPYIVYKNFDSQKLFLESNPTERLKAIKNKTEIENIRKYYLLDSVAVTKFLYQMKKYRENSLGDQMMTEYDAMCLMDSLREEIKGYLDKSFTTISAYGENASMMHYEATKDKCSVIKRKGMLLVDSGGQYLGATTDVTRTIAMGDVTDKMKLHFTKVLEGMLSLANTKFLYGCTGRNLDILARKPLWDIGMDYKCGTGHGVGYILNVHEGPQNIRYRYVEGIKETVLEEGMLVTDEPGVYLEGQYGIRTENVLLVQKDFENADGQFMKFEMLTVVPIDLELIDINFMSPSTREQLNAYHHIVYERVAPFLTKEEQIWLKENTKKV